MKLIKLVRYGWFICSLCITFKIGDEFLFRYPRSRILVHVIWRVIRTFRFLIWMKNIVLISIEASKLITCFTLTVLFVLWCEDYIIFLRLQFLSNSTLKIITLKWLYSESSQRELNWKQLNKKQQIYMYVLSLPSFKRSLDLCPLLILSTQLHYTSSCSVVPTFHHFLFFSNSSGYFKLLSTCSFPPCSRACTNGTSVSECSNPCWTCSALSSCTGELQFPCHRNRCTD